MSKLLRVTLGVLVLFAAPAAAQPSAVKRTIQVNVTYTGSGTVNASHKIYVALWDAPDMGGGAVAGLEEGDRDVFGCAEGPGVCQRGVRPDRELGRPISTTVGLLPRDVQQGSSKASADRRCARKNRQGQRHVQRFCEGALNFTPSSAASTG